MFELDVTNRLDTIAAASASVLLEQLPSWTIRSDRGFEPLKQALEATIYAFLESLEFTATEAEQKLHELDSPGEPPLRLRNSHPTQERPHGDLDAPRDPTW